MLDDIIPIFNEIEELNKKLKIDALELPQITVIGSQSSGKSSVLERIVGNDILPKGTGTVTRCPLRLKLINDLTKLSDNDEFVARFSHDPEKSYNNFSLINKEIEIKTRAMMNKSKNQVISSTEIVLEIRGPQFPTLTLVDLPGFVKNPPADQPNLEEEIQNLCKEYIDQKSCLILAISPANIDMATSEAIYTARKYDPKGLRTLHVLTKADIMDPGTSLHDILDKDHNWGQGVIIVVNRTQEGLTKKLSIEEHRDKELDFLRKQYPIIAAQHGTSELINKLKSILKQSLQKCIPDLKIQTEKLIEKYEKELKELEPEDKESVVCIVIDEFSKYFQDKLDGNLDVNYENALEGGANISEILYKKFPTILLAVKNHPITEEAMENIIKNKAGTRDFSHSFMPSFEYLIKKDINQLEDPIKQIFEEVKSMLLDFIQDSIRNIPKFQKYPLLEIQIEEISRKLILKNFKKCENRVEGMWKCEKYDITLTNPFTDMFSILDNMKVLHDREGSSMSLDTDKSILKSLDESSDIPVRAFYSFLHMGIKMSGYSGLENSLGLLDYVKNFIEDVGLKNRKDEIINDIKNNFETFNEQLRNSTTFQDSSEQKSGLFKTQKYIFENLLEKYFLIVQQNLINYFPKCMHYFVLRDIERKMRNSMNKGIIQANLCDDLLSNPDNETRIKNLHEEIKNLKEVEQKLKEIHFSK